MDNIQLGNIAASSKNFYLIPGMRVYPKQGTYFYRVIEVSDGYIQLLSENDWKLYSKSEPHNLIPDLQDPSTMGCLLHLVRSAWKDENIYPARAMYGEKMYWRLAIKGGPVSYKETEAEVLVQALIQSDHIS